MTAKWVLLLTSLPLTPLSSDSFETLFSGEQSGQWHSLLLFTSSELGIGLNRSYSAASDTWDLMGGCNSNWFSVGYLDDSGLASEIRNPECDALSRLTERTFHRSDLRSDSTSRIGLAVFPANQSLGLVAERRDSIESVAVFLAPPSGCPWNFDAICQLGRLHPGAPDESWYPEEPDDPGGHLFLLSSRVRRRTAALDLGITAMVSGGTELRPGFLAASALQYDDGPWRLRARGTLSTPYFRNADGERLDMPLGVSFDLRYRPPEGLQFGSDYRIGAVAIHPEGLEADDEVGFAIGWRFSELQISAETDWNSFILPVPTNGEPVLRRIGAELCWDKDGIHMDCSGTWDHEEREFRAGFDSDFPVGAHFRTETGFDIHGDASQILADLSFRGHVELTACRLVATLGIDDIQLPPDGGEQAPPDWQFEIRCIFNTASD